MSGPSSAPRSKRNRLLYGTAGMSPVIAMLAAPQPAIAAVLPPGNTVGVCSGVSLSKSTVTDLVTPLVYAGIQPIETTTNSILHSSGLATLLGGALTGTTLNVDLSPTVTSITSGNPITLKVLADNHQVIAPDATCFARADGFTLSQPLGLAIGGNIVTGLGDNPLNAASAGDIDSIAFGNKATSDAAAVKSVAIGTSSAIAAAGAGAVAVGNATTVSAVNGVALGNAATVTGSNALALGAAAQASGAAGVALGVGATVSAANSAAIGANAVAARGGQASYTGYALTVPTLSAGEVSVGAAGAERQLTNVAAGSGGTDAVNVNQLAAVGTKVDTLAGLAVAYDSTGHNAITLGGSGGTAITNVRAGTLAANSTDAVNGSQLLATNTNVTSVANAVTAVDNRVTTTNTAVAGLGNAVTTVDNRVTTVDGRVTGLNTAVNNGAIGVARYSDAGQPTVPLTTGAITNDVTLVGAAGGVRLHNIAGGVVGATSTDAVNGSQLAATNTAVGAVDARVTTNAAAITGINTAIGGLNTSVGAIGDRVTQNATDITNLGTRLTGDEGDIADLQGGVAGNTSAIAALGGRVTTAETAIATNTTAITDLGDRVTTAETNIAGNTSAIAGLDTRVSTTETGIAGNTSAITNLTGRVSTTETNVANNTTAITNLDNRVTTVDNRVTDLGGRMTTAETNISTLGGQVTTLGTSVTDLSARTATNATDIAANTMAITNLDDRVTTVDGRVTDLGGRMTTAETNITSLGGQVATLGNNVTDLSTRTTTNEAGIAANTTAITDLGGRMTTAESNIASLGGQVATLGTSVTDLSARTSANETGIAGNTSAIATLTGRTATNETDIAGNTGAIAALGTRTTTNEASIAANATAITALDGRVTTNTDAIAGLDVRVTQNGTDIATNATAIATLHDSVANGAIGPVQYSNAVSPTVPNGGVPSNQVTLVGAAGGAVGLHNVAAGTVSAVSTDAVNGSQLYAVASQITGDNGLAVAYDDNVRDHVTLGGVRAAGRVGLSNLADATLAAGSSEAVTGSQLYATNQQLAGLTGSLGTIGDSIAGLDARVTTNTTAIATVDARVTGVTGSVTDLSGRVATAETNIAGNTGAITAIDARVTGIAGSVADLSGRVANTETGLANATTAITANTSAIDGLDNRITTVSGTVASLGGRVAASEDAITGLDGRVTANTADIATIDARVSSVDSGFGAFSLAVSNGAVGPLRYSNAATPVSPNGGTVTNDVTLVGASPAPVGLHNVAAGTLSASSTDAVNGSQLYAIASAVTGDTGLAVAYDDATRGHVTLGGGSATGRVGLSNLADGAVAAGSGDAVTGGQLYATNQSVSGLGDGLATVATRVSDLDTRVTGVTDGVASLDTTVTGLGSQVATLSGDTAALRGDLTGLSGAIANGAVGTVRFSDAAHPTVSNGGVPSQDMTLVGADPAAPVTLHNVAAGRVAQGSTDAVNGGQLFATNQSVATVAGSVATVAGSVATLGTGYATLAQSLSSFSASVSGGGVGPVRYSDATSPGVANGGVPSQDLTLVGAAQGTVGLHNVAAGTIGAGSADAVNGGQLAALGSTLAGTLGAVRYDPATNGFAGGYHYGGATFATVQDALDAIPAGGTVAPGGAAIRYVHTNSVLADSMASGTDSTAIGAAALSSGVASLAIGDGAVADRDNSVALGSAAQTTRGAVSGYAAFGLDAAQTSNGEIAVGQTIAQIDPRTGAPITTGNRQITGVAAGSADSDAVTVSQLRGVSTALGAAAASGLGGGALYDPATGRLTGPRYTLAGVTYGNVGDALQALATIGTGTGTGGGTPVAVTDPAAPHYDDQTHTSLSLAPGGTLVSNVAAGGLTAGSTDAVNGGQLYATNQQVAANTQAVATLAANVDNGAVGTVRYSNAATPAVANGGTRTNDVALVGADAAAPVGLHNVAAGQVATGSTDAVNGGQLAATNAHVATVEGTANTALTMAQGAVRYDDAAHASVSLGNGAGGGVAVHDVADGTSARDAVNLGQLASATNTAITQAEAYADQKIARLSFDLNTVKKDQAAGTAGALALAGLPQPYEAGKGMIAMGVGGFQGQSAVALGLAKALADEHTVVKLGATYNSRGNLGMNAGVGYQF